VKNVKRELKEVGMRKREIEFELMGDGEG